jgi:nucleoside-diphosphate-sugar epimerase
MQATIPYLLKMGHNIRGVDSFFRYGRIERKRGYEFIEGDLCDPKVAKEVCKGVDIIFQAAARIFGVGGFHKYPADILSKDLVLHQNILWQALSNNVQRVVYISSSMVYERATKVPSEEADVADMPVPLTDYGLSKLVGERLSQAFYKQYQLKYTIWRPFNIITPYERGEDEPGIAHVFADFIKKIVIDRQNPVEIFGDGEQIRCFTWIEDVASAIAKYSFEPVTDCQVFNLGNPEPVTLKELATKIYNVAKERGVIPAGQHLNFITLPAYEDDVRVRIPFIEKVKRVLGWEPKVKLDEALHRCVDEAIKLASRG